MPVPVAIHFTSFLLQLMNKITHKMSRKEVLISICLYKQKDIDSTPSEIQFHSSVELR